MFSFSSSIPVRYPPVDGCFSFPFVPCGRFSDCLTLTLALSSDAGLAVFLFMVLSDSVLSFHAFNGHVACDDSLSRSHFLALDTSFEPSFTRNLAGYNMTSLIPFRSASSSSF